MTTENTDIQAQTQEIANQLGETDEKPVSQIAQLIEHMGYEWVKAQVEDTERIEEKGGMKTDDGQRQRTKGGVFFYVAKGKMEDEVRLKIFPEFGKASKPIEWDERHEYLDPLRDGEEHGEMRYVNFTLHGRPGKVVEVDNTVITTISYVHKRLPLPKGVPQPPKEPTLYTVYMSKKQWDDVAPVLEEFKADRLIVEGTICFDSETESIAVFASRITTRRIEKQGDQPTDSDQDEDEVTEVPPTPEPVEPAADDIETKLKQLHNAANKLRARIDDMEAKGQRGINMTRQLLRNTEKKIEALENSQVK
ncbi:MAG: hypothetical protein ACFE0Q_12580 [Anaerolineae bacterium]